MKKLQILFLKLVFGVLGIFIAAFWKIQIAFGSSQFFFSASNIVGPLFAFYAGPWAALGVFLLKRVISVVLLDLSFFSAFSTHIPTLCAAWYWSMPSAVIRLLVPLTCMIMFMLHPVGSQAWIYCLYWLIPTAIYFLPWQSFFTLALAVTFVQHAVGSIIWLYVMPTTPALWYSLLPVVIIERLVFATGMVVLAKCLRAFNAQVRQRTEYFGRCSFFFNQSTYTSREITT